MSDLEFVSEYQRRCPLVIVEADAKETGNRFSGRPERWWNDPHWRCENGHVSTRYLKSEELGTDVCLSCRGWIWLTFPEDKDDPGTEQVFG